MGINEKRRYKIGNLYFETAEEYKAGKRDLLQIQRLLEGIDARDGMELRRLYRTVKERPFLFESMVGVMFREYLEELVYDRTYSQEQKGSIQSVFEDLLNRCPEQKKDKSKEKGKASFAFILLLLGILMMGFAFVKIAIYGIQDFKSRKKMEQLAACILKPYDATVSEEHRIADLVASGLYTEEEAFEVVRGETESIEFDDDGPKILYEYSLLYNRNSDMAGWLCIEGTEINYPVMQTVGEEEYYLHRDFDKEEDRNGLPFVSASCDILHPGSNFLVYGHNMKSGAMFADLLNYEKETFYHEHPVIQFDTIYEKGVYDILGVFQTRVLQTDEEGYRYYHCYDAETEEEFEEYISFVKANTFYDTGVTAKYGDTLLTLSTCDRRIEDGRFAVVAKKRAR